MIVNAADLRNGELFLPAPSRSFALETFSFPAIGFPALFRKESKDDDAFAPPRSSFLSATLSEIDFPYWIEDFCAGFPRRSRDVSFGAIRTPSAKLRFSYGPWGGVFSLWFLLLFVCDTFWAEPVSFDLFTSFPSSLALLPVVAMLTFAAIATALLFAYLFVALLKPELFP